MRAGSGCLREFLSGLLESGTFTCHRHRETEPPILRSPNHPVFACKVIHQNRHPFVLLSTLYLYLNFHGHPNPNLFVFDVLSQPQKALFSPLRYSATERCRVREYRDDLLLPILIRGGRVAYGPSRPFSANLLLAPVWERWRADEAWWGRVMSWRDGLRAACIVAKALRQEQAK